MHQALPFIGFGFLDNLIMIVAGDYKDLTLGTALGITTLAAAALGNTISDIAGIGSAWYVESVVIRVGVRPPQLTPQQQEMQSSRWAANLGRALGVTLGCLLGMIPLRFLPTPAKDLAKHKARESAAKESEKEQPCFPLKEGAQGEASAALSGGAMADTLLLSALRPREGQKTIVGFFN